MVLLPTVSICLKKWQAKVSMRIYFTDDAGFEEFFLSDSFVVQNINADPTGGVGINGELREYENLEAYIDFSDKDGIGEVSYTWFIDDLFAASGKTFALETEHIGRELSVKAEYIDGFGASETVLTDFGLIANTNDAPIINWLGTEEGGEYSVGLKEWSMNSLNNSQLSSL